MSASCCHGRALYTASVRRVLWIALLINAGMCLAEIAAGILAGSASLQADALDFLADASNYLLSLAVVAASLHARAKAALLKGATMGLLGVWVLGSVAWHAIAGRLPEPMTMGAIAGLALLANLLCFALLYAYRHRDANMHSVWICSRNDVVANLAVLAAAVGVFGTGTAWPDLVVAAVMAGLSVQGAVTVIRRARRELERPSPASPVRMAYTTQP
jgi:Co/Zn/Cd efflux system component